MSNYEQNAIQFAKKHNVKLTTLSEEFRKYFPDDKHSRSVFKMKLTRDRRSYTFTFGQSISNSGIEPTMYDVLSCLTKYDPEDFESFCDSYGYDNDSRKAEKIYKAVVKEYNAVCRLFSDVMDELINID